MRATLRHWLVGHPLPTSQLIHERITKFKGLAAGAAALTLSMPIALAISTVLAIVAFSYHQTIHA